jgi:hypothetical protein
MRGARSCTLEDSHFQRKVGSCGLRTHSKAEAEHEFIVTIDICGRVSEDLTLWRVVTLEVCGIEGFGNLKHGVLKLIVVIDLGRERGPLILSRQLRTSRVWSLGDWHCGELKTPEALKL